MKLLKQIYKAVVILIMLLSLSLSEGQASEAVDSIQLLEEQLSSAVQSFEQHKVIELSISIALLHSDHGNYIKSNEYLKKALNLSRKENYNKGLFLSLNNLGNFYLRTGFYDRALEYYYQALESAKVLKNNQYKNTVLNNLGVVYSEIGNYESALSSFFEALILSKSINDQEKIANNTTNIGSAYLKRNDVEQALVYFQKAEKIYEKVDSGRKLGVVKSNIAHVYAVLGDSSLAKKYYEEASLLLRKDYDSFVLTNNLLWYSRLLFSQQESHNALAVLEEALDITANTNSHESYKRIYAQLETYYYKANKVDSAYYCKIYSSLYSDSIAYKSNKTLAERYQVKYDLRQKEQELIELKSEARLRMFVIGGSIFVIVIIFFSAILWYRERVRNLKKEKVLAKIKLEKTHAEHEKLQSEYIAKEEINSLNQEKLQTEIDHKSRELASVTMHILSKNEMLSSLKGQLKEISSKEMNVVSKQSVKKMNVEIQRNLRADYDWDNFKLHFEQVHPGFFDKLLSSFPALNANDLRLCAYVVMDLNSKEISQLFNISPDSVRKRRQRLRNKLSLTADDNVKLFLSHLSYKL